MDNITNETIKRLISIIKVFNKDTDIKYLEIENINTLEDFIKLNSEFILNTIDYIKVYIDIYNRLNNLSLNGVNIDCSDMYDPNYLETLIQYYQNNSNNYIIRNILFNQIITIYNNLNKCKHEIFLINKILITYIELFEIEDINTYNKYIEELIKLLNEDNEDGGTTLDELLNNFSNTLKKSYGLRKKNIKVKVLRR